MLVPPFPDRLPKKKFCGVWNQSAFSEMSGTARDPLPQGWLDWNDGAAKMALQPPPEPPSLAPQPSGPPDQATSKLYSGPELRLSSVPPAPTTSGSEAGYATDRWEQSSKAPRSPDAAVNAQPRPTMLLKMAC